MKKSDPLRAVNDHSRHTSIRGKAALVPLKYDDAGNPATPETVIIKKLTLLDLRFLAVWQELGYLEEVAKVAEKAKVDLAVAERCIKKLACFKAEDARTRALAGIPSPDWIAAKHVENLYEGGRLQDSEHRSLQELAKIEGAYKQPNVAPGTLNVFNISLTPEQEAALKPVFDTLALDSHVA